MKYKEDWTYAEKAHKNPYKKCEKQEKHHSDSDTCKKMRVVNLWKLNSKH